MRIAVLWDWEIVPSQAYGWQDGLAAALKVLGERHEVKVYACGDYAWELHNPLVTIDILPAGGSMVMAIQSFRPDVILIWGDQTRPHALPLAKLGIPLALCFAGGEALGDNYTLFDHIFVESQVYKDVYDKAGVSCSIAFGTNTELFKPIAQAKAFDTIFPATFALWKRHDLYAKATAGLRSLACGYIYDKHEQECWQVCLDNNVTILPHVSADVLHYLYAASKVCVIPSLSSGGSQRTVLEAMAMNLPLVVCDSDKFDYTQGQSVWGKSTDPKEIRETIDSIIGKGLEVNTREHVLANWSEYTYADNLEKELQRLCDGN